MNQQFFYNCCIEEKILRKYKYFLHSMNAQLILLKNKLMNLFNFSVLVKKSEGIENYKVDLIKDQYFKLKRIAKQMLFILSIVVYAIIAHGYYKANYNQLMVITLISMFVVIILFLWKLKRQISDELAAVLFIYIPIGNILLKDVFFLLQKNPLIDTIFLHTQFILIFFISFSGLITNYRHILYIGFLSILWIWTFTFCTNDPFLWSLVLLDSAFFIGITIVLYFAYSNIHLMAIEFDRSGRTIIHQHEELNKLSEFKDSMLNMIIHDIKNPINNLLAASKKPTILKEEIAEQSNNILLIVENILDIHKMEDSKMTLKLSTFVLDGIIEHAINRVGYLLEEKKITLTTLTTVKTSVEGDNELLERVFINLLTNAIKHSNMNSNIDMKVILAANKVRVEITDQGVGIALEESDRIFDKYYQINSRKSGNTRSTGLGLTFCKLVIETHGGSIGVTSVLNHGATFWFELPIMTVIDSKIVEEERCNYPKKYQNSELEEKQFTQYKLMINKLSIYQTSEILNIFKTSPVGASPDFQAWKEEIINSSISGNTEYFNRLKQIAN